MSGIYKKTETFTITADFIKCDKCGAETQFSSVIDTWCIVDGENYCLKCQKKHKVGWFKKTN